MGNKEPEQPGRPTPEAAQSQATDPEDEEGQPHEDATLAQPVDRLATKDTDAVGGNRQEGQRGDQQEPGGDPGIVDPGPTGHDIWQREGGCLEKEEGTEGKPPCQPNAADAIGVRLIRVG